MKWRRKTTNLTNSLTPMCAPVGRRFFPMPLVKNLMDT